MSRPAPAGKDVRRGEVPTMQPPGSARSASMQPNWESALPSVDASPAPAKRSKTVRRLIDLGWNLLPPLTFAAMVGLWSASITVFKIPPYLLPAPGAVFARIVADAPMLWLHSQITLAEIVMGFGLTVVTAIPLGLAIALSRVARQVMYPPL